MAFTSLTIFVKHSVRIRSANRRSEREARHGGAWIFLSLLHLGSITVHLQSLAHAEIRKSTNEK